MLGVLPEIVDVLTANGTIRDAVLGVEDFLCLREELSVAFVRLQFVETFLVPGVHPFERAFALDLLGARGTGRRG